MADPVKVVFFTNATSTVSLPVLQRLHEAAIINVRQVVLYDTVSGARKQLVAIARRHGLKRVVAKVAGLVAARLRSLIAGPAATDQTCRAYCQQHGISAMTVQQVNAPDVIAALRAIEADVFVVCSFSQIMKQELIGLPSQSAINVHPSLLPKYRGPDPIFWALYHGEANSGVSFHILTPGIDAGAIIRQVEMPISPYRSFDALSDRLFDVAAEHIVDVVRSAAGDDVKASAQDETLASYFGMPTPAERRELDQRLRGRT